MNNCRAGLYSFASTATWLHETGMASPPLLVMLGLTLPDSRILSGIASIGLTLANIAIILPYLRQPILDILESARTHEQSTQKHIGLSSNVFNSLQTVDLPPGSPILSSASPCEGELPNPPLTCSATVNSPRSVDAESLQCQNTESEVAPRTKLLLPARKVDDDQIPLQISRSPDADSSEQPTYSSHLFSREGRSALYIPLPVPDAEEVAFFDAVNAALPNGDLGDSEEYSVVARGRHTVPEEHITIQNHGSTAEKRIGRDVRLVAVDVANTQDHAAIGEGSPGITMPFKGGKLAPTPTKVSTCDHSNLVPDGSIPDFTDGLPACESAVQSGQPKHSLVEGKEATAKCRPESLEFVPQSVIRRYSSAPMVSVGHCFEHQAFSSGKDHPVLPVSPRIFVHSLLEGARPRASYTTLEGHWHTSFLTRVHSTGRSKGEQSLIIETTPIQNHLEQGPIPPPDPPAEHELAPLKKYPTHKHRLGVLARATLRDRRSAANRRDDDGSSGSSTPDTESDFDSDSQHSSGSSVYDSSILPHILGTDLIAAIDANSESELDLARSRGPMRAPLNLYEDFLISENSVADISMIMHVSSNDDASDGGARAPTAFRPLTSEDIQQWASGVVQKCVRQVCHSRVPPSSPSQVSDVCAERPSGLGVSQCPLSGLHCKLGAAALTEVPKTKASPALFPPPGVLSSRKPLQVRNLRDIPEFVPRQRHAAMIARRMENPRKVGTRSALDVTRDAATQVIARMENRAGFNARQFVGTETRMVNTSGVQQGTLRCG